MSPEMDQQPQRRVERPRIEPEIIPPGESPARADRIFGGRSTHRIYVAGLGPVGFFMLVLTTALIGALVLLLVAGALVVLLPVAGLLLAVALVTSSLRGSSRRRF
jgi:hypothetical protein